MRRATQVYMLYCDEKTAASIVKWRKQLGGKLLQPCFRWANENARAWDTHVQGLAFVIPSPIVRRFLEMLTRMLAPPLLYKLRAVPEVDVCRVPRQVP